MRLFMESHILSESAAYCDWKFLHVNLKDRPKIEKPVTTCFSICLQNNGYFYRADTVTCVRAGNTEQFLFIQINNNLYQFN